VADDPTECVFGALVITRAWCDARNAVYDAIGPGPADIPGSPNPSDVQRALESINNFEKEVNQYSKPGQYSRCPGAIAGRFNERHHEFIKQAKEELAKGNYSATMDLLSEAL
jgi:hypothetical protein